MSCRVSAWNSSVSTASPLLFVVGRDPRTLPAARMLDRMSSTPDAPPSTSAARRPQAERSQETRTRILDAAVELLVAEGYARANTLAIQAKAGVSRGRL